MFIATLCVLAVVAVLIVILSVVLFTLDQHDDREIG
jgi:hypothetical protein